MRLIYPALISESDIVAVDLRSGLMTLKQAAYQRLPQPSTAMPQFVAVADGDRLFLGAFGTTLSSGPGRDGQATIVVDTLP